MSSIEVQSVTDLFSVQGRTAIITGASSGLGERFVRVLHNAGARVIVGARRRDRLEDLATELGERVVPVACDVSVPEDRDRLLAAAGGRLDILVNNAGIGKAVAAEMEDLDDWQRTLDVNLTGAFALAQGAFPLLKDGGGSIINVSSILGLVAASPIKQASYCASKGAITNLTRELGCQWGIEGVRVNAIAPGWFPTEMTSEGLLDDQSSRRFVERNTPIGRPGLEHELDGALLFLASDASSYVTGTTVVVDGGWTAR